MKTKQNTLKTFYSTRLCTILIELFRGKYIDNCRDISLKTFIDILDGHNLRLLKTYGVFSNAKAKKAWDKIIAEYTEISGGGGNNNLLALVKFVAFMETKVSLIYFCLRSMKNGYNENIVNVMKRLGIKSTINRFELIQGINRVATEVKGMESMIDDRKKDIDKLTSKSNEFESLLIDLSKYQGYQIDTNKTSVFEFNVLVQKYKKYIKDLKKDNGRAYN